jgi:hypothetical protein
MHEALFTLISLPFSKPRPEPGQEQEPAQETEDGPKEQLGVYRLILMRYRDMIEEKEAKSITEMKGLVKPFDKIVLDERDRITDQFHPYMYEEKFSEAADMALSRVAEIDTIKLPLVFWFSFDEMVHLGAADEMGKALFLCSLIRALENDDARVLVTGSRKPFVLFSFKGEHFLVDISSGEKSASRGREEALKKLGTDKVLYSFNDREYEDYVEEK